VPNLPVDRTPIVPDIPGLRFQAVHTEDAAEAFRRAVVGHASGAFNMAAEPVITPADLPELLGARPVKIPTQLARGGLWTAWHLGLVPASPGLFDAVLHIPIMDTRRAREELDWPPEHSGREALQEFFEGLHAGSGEPTEPLYGDSRNSSGRLRELLTGRQ